MRLVHCLPVLLALPFAAAAEPDARTWFTENLSIPTRAETSGAWHPMGGRLHATDPLTLWGVDGPPLPVPDQTAEMFILYATESGEDSVGLFALIWSNAPVACGEDLGSVPVDTGLAGFLTPDDVTALERYGQRYGDNLYDGPYAEQIEKNWSGPFLAELPGGTHFPITSSGWGDGFYPVFGLLDQDGEMIALYMQFITDGQEWLVPPVCDGASG